MAVEKRFPGWYGKRLSFINQQEFNNFRDQLANVFDNLGFDPEDDVNQAIMNSFFDIKPDPKPFIQWLGCGQTWADSIDCGNLTQIDSVRDRFCTTILHRGAMLYDVINRPELFNSSSSRNSDSPYSYFDAKEVIRMVVNFEPEDYADLKRQIGARILFHDSNFVAASGDLDFFITRGYRYDFTIDRKDTKLIDEPYGECWNYDKYNIDKYKTRIDPRVPLSGHTCFQNCVVRNIIHISKCWPTTMPYFRNDSFDLDLKLKACSWFKGSHHVSIFSELIRVDELRKRQRNNETVQQQGNLTVTTMATTNPDNTNNPTSNREMIVYKKIRRFCWSQCILSCHMAEYSVTLTRSAWPTNVEVLFDNTSRQRSLRHCCALVTIKFTHFHYNVHELKPKYNVANTIGDLGGLLAVWLGLSIVSVYHAFQKLLELCTRRSLVRIRVSSLVPT